MQCDKQTNLYIQFLCWIFEGINYLILTIMLTAWGINVLFAGICLFFISAFQGWRALKSSRTRSIIGRTACVYGEAFIMATMLYSYTQSLRYILILLVALAFEGIAFVVIYHRYRIFHKK